MKKKFIALLLSGALLVSAAVWPASAASVEQFTDVDSGDWFYAHVDYVAENGLLNGSSQTTFGPEASMTRGMFVTVLGNMTGIDTGLYPGTRFDDVPASEYYASRINWATENGIVSGLGGGKFGPENSVTREQAAIMLYNYAKRTGNDTSYSASVYNSFPDTSAVSSYAVEPLKWATSQGIINGSDGKLNPQGTATRAQIAAILHNAEKVLVKTELLPQEEKPAENLAGTWISVDGKKLAGFDPSKGLDVPETDYIDSAIYNVTGKVEIHNVPKGWTVDCDMRVNGATGKESAVYVLKNGDKTYRWYFDGASNIVHTVDELYDFRPTLNGKAVDCDPTKDVEIHGVWPSDMVGYEGQPSTWIVVQGPFTENGVSGYRYYIHPNNADTPCVTYRFYYDAPDPIYELEGVTAVLDDGSPVTGFDPLNQEDIFSIPVGHKVFLQNVPDDWRQQTLYRPDGGIIIEVSSSGKGSYTYWFNPDDDYQWS